MKGADFLELLYGQINDGFIEITYLTPKGIKLYPHTVVQWRQLPLGTFDRSLTNVHTLNKRGYGAYFGVAVRKDRKYPEDRIDKNTGEKFRMEHPRGTQMDALYLTAFYADADAKVYKGGSNEALDRVRAMKPSVIVQSGGGYHGYFLLDAPLRIDDGNRVDVKRTLQGIAVSAGLDTAVAELARVLRIPDTVNTKPERQSAPCTVVEVNSTRYCYADLFDQYAPFVKVNAKPDRIYNHNTSSGDVEDALMTIPADQISYAEWIAILAALHHDLGETEALTLAERWTGWCSKNGEVEAKMASFRGSTSINPSSLGSVFFHARNFGYERPYRPPSRGMSMSNKARINENVTRLSPNFF